jgi:hypothetical protein
MISKYSTIGITAITVASLTAVLAQTRANSVASGHREILLQTLNRGTANLTRTTPPASHNSRRSS